jgi:hypothetical protein
VSIAFVNRLATGSTPIFLTMCRINALHVGVAIGEEVTYPKIITAIE